MVRSNTVRRRLWLAGGMAAAAAVVATGAFGLSAGGTITTIAGTGKPGYSGDGGPAAAAQLYAPQGVAVDGQGNVYIAEPDNDRVRKVSPGGTITTIAGGRHAAALAGDGGPATSARLTSPNWVAVDRQGNVYIADFDNSRVRKVSPGGTITTFAGTGIPGFSGDGGPATSARLSRPAGGGGGRAGERLHRRLQRRPCAQGEPRRDDHDVRRHGQYGLFRGRRPGDLGAVVRPATGWRWTGRGTSTSPIADNRACAR